MDNFDNNLRVSHSIWKAHFSHLLLELLHDQLCSPSHVAQRLDVDFRHRAKTPTLIGCGSAFLHERLHRGIHNVFDGPLVRLMSP